MSVEHGVAQKLMMMQNDSVRLSSMKAQLKANAEQVRREIGRSISQQMALIRAREESLLAELESVVSNEEELLSAQQKVLHCNIGACEQLMANLKKDVPVSNAEDVLSHLNHTDLSVKANATISFESDALLMRNFVCTFGSIALKKASKLAGESLPHELEDYEDDLTMAHKSVYPFALGQRSVQNSHTMKRWLSKLPVGSNASDINALMREFEVIRATCDDEMDIESQTSSFEAVKEFEEVKPALLTNAFVEMLKRPLSEWLAKALPYEIESKPTVVEPSRSLKRRHSMHNIAKPATYEFEEVIAKVVRAPNSEWNKQEKTIEDCDVCTDTSEVESSTSCVTETNQEKEAVETKSTFDETAFVNHLRSFFDINRVNVGASTSTASSNIITSEDWKKIIERNQNASKNANISS